MVKSYEFSPAFLWGAATSAYQIEGSPLADGAGPSIWHRFVRTPGLVLHGHTGDVACDHYRCMKDDVLLMKQLGLNAYRFSIAWGRIFPSGRGAVNEAGMDFYERLVDTLLENGIEPVATLFHWDLPLALDDRGGWLNPDVADWFADYASAMYRRLDGRVKKWTTLNEPWVVADGGYLHGALAPGHKNLYEAPIASHQLLRAHGKAVRAYRAEGRHEVGLVVNLAPKHAASERAEDIAATRRADAYMNRQYLDPVLLGSYPDEMKEIFGDAWPQWPAEDFALISEKIDFVGVNYYMRDVIRHDEAEVAGQDGGRAPGAVDVYPYRLGGLPEGADRDPGLGQGPLRRHPAVRDRERRRLLRCALRTRRPDPRPAAGRLLPRPPAGDPRRDRGRRRPARLFRLVAAGQPRVVPRVLDALRAGARQLPDAGARSQGQRALLRRGDRLARGGARRRGRVTPSHDLAVVERHDVTSPGRVA